MVEGSGSSDSEARGTISVEEVSVVYLEEAEPASFSPSGGSDFRALQSLQKTLLAWPGCLLQRVSRPIRVLFSATLPCSAMMVLSAGRHKDMMKLTHRVPLSKPLRVRRRQGGGQAHLWNPSRGPNLRRKIKVKLESASGGAGPFNKASPVLTDAPNST